MCRCKRRNLFLLQLGFFRLFFFFMPFSRKNSSCVASIPRKKLRARSKAKNGSNIDPDKQNLPTVCFARELELLGNQSTWVAPKLFRLPDWVSTFDRQIGSIHPTKSGPKKSPFLMISLLHRRSKFRHIRPWKNEDLVELYVLFWFFPDSNNSVQ